MPRSAVLVVGSGAREHALARALQRGPAPSMSGGPGDLPEKPCVFVAPGNGGIDETEGLTQCDLDVRDPRAVVALAKKLGVDLVVIGPEGPLADGVVDALAEAGVLAFGPNKKAARLEESKAFLKDFAVRWGIRTARHKTVRSLAEAEAEVAFRGAPIVIKADGLAAGKGVVVAETADDALAAARSMLVDRVFGTAGDVVVIEEVIRGREVSVHAISDGERYLLLPAARDHKRLLDGDTGPNTGGMGVIAPVSDIDPVLMDRIDREIIRPTIDGMRQEGSPFRGALFAGVIVAENGDPYLLEHNVRFGDPECEALMELIEGNLMELLCSAARGSLHPSSVRVRSDLHAAVIVLAAAGYPAATELGAVISGIDQVNATSGVQVHHAGTKSQDGLLRVAGGRVLAVTSVTSSNESALSNAYRAIGSIRFEGVQFRRDIGR